MHKKASSPPPYWQSILTKIKNLGLRPEIMAMLNNFNQIVWDTAPPASNPNAVAYVSSEDKDSDGKIDKIHFVLNKFPPNANEEDIEGKELDPWQKSYLAQADIMTDSVQERLEQEEKINSMANALDKMFKY